MRRATKRTDWGGIAFLLALYMAPAAIARGAFHSGWRSIAIAYAMWLGALFLFSLWPGSGSWREKAGWAFGLGMFFTTPVVLTILLLLNEVAGVR